MESSERTNKVPSWEEIEVLKERLKTLMAEREKQYEDMNLWGKCTAIAEELGKGHPKKYGTYWEYKDDNLTIGYDDYGRNLWVIWNGRMVLEVHLGKLKLFRPGSWIRKICQLALKANQIIDERERTEKFKDLMTEMKKWEEVKE